MSIAAELKASIIGEYRRSEDDSGSPEVQVAILTHRIKHLTGHLQAARKDYSSQRGLRMMVGKRTRLLRYLARTDRARYQTLIQQLGLRK